MNRREALAALVALPATSRISVAQLKPDDVIVIECDYEIGQPDKAHLKDMVQGVWPGRKIVVLSGGLKLKIASGA